MSRRVVIAVVVIGCLAFGRVAGAVPPAVPDTADTFEYPLRAGESLGAVSRVFGVPVSELVERNRIADPDRLPVGQTIRIPNRFAREAAALRDERDRLVVEVQRLEEESQDRSRLVEQLESGLRQVEGEKTALAEALSSAEGWKSGARIFAAALVLLLAWTVKALVDRAIAHRRWRAVTAENAALMTAKEKYRAAAAQVDLRCQMLYSGRGDPPREAVAEGTAQISRAFAEGAARIERLLGDIRTGYGEDEQKVPTGRREGGSHFRRLRDRLGRQRRPRTAS